MKTQRLSIALLGLCLISLSYPVQAQLQGTLFTSPEQRAYLDYLRSDFLAKRAEKGFDIAEAEIPEIPEAVVEEAPVEIYTFGGVMARRDGSHAMWLNGKLLGESQLPAGTSLVENAGVLSLRFTTENDVYILKPGQTLELGAGTIIEESQRTPPPAPAASAENTAVSVIATAESANASEDNLPDAVTEDTASETKQPTVMELQQLIQTLQSLQGGESAQE